MGIVLGKISTAAPGTDHGNNQRPPVPGAVLLTPLEMNMLHFGSEKHTPIAGNNGSTRNHNA